MNKSKVKIFYQVYMIVVSIMLILLVIRYLNLKESYSDISSDLQEMNEEVVSVTISANDYLSEIEELTNKNNDLSTLVEKKDNDISQSKVDINLLYDQIKDTHLLYQVNDTKIDFAKAISSSFLLLNAIINKDMDSINDMINVNYISTFEKELDNISNLISCRFEYSDELSITVEQSFNSNGYYVHISSGENTISFYYYNEYGSTICYPTIQIYSQVDEKVQIFYDAIKNEDVYNLRRSIAERDHVPTEEEGIEILNRYKERFDIDTLKIELKNIDNTKFFYILKGKKNNIEVSEVICGEYNEVPILKDYFGYEDWERVDPEY